ncbi:hypothetical protein SAMN04488057_101314 [Cyclobacterium lianum]|uniref:Uncharacterized protein n=1 Tax=Cyclobacterium lianum TaxID=388280 RepID=A0A1M7IFR8_9BACT|nr:hypothetical protein SAMN04488057_101314 [Cyclobacterium lianum]
MFSFCIVNVINNSVTSEIRSKFLKPTENNLRGSIFIEIIKNTLQIFQIDPIVRGCIGIKKNF